MSQHESHRYWALAIAVFGIVGALAGPATADIVVSSSVNNQGTDNVLLNPADDAALVTGTVGPSDLLTEFTSTSGSGLLDADPSGQALITGGLGNEDLQNLSFNLENNQTFTRAVFNINSADDGNVLITVEGVNITGGTFSQSFELDQNGENFFTVDAINGQLITSIDLTAVDDLAFQDVRQVRLGGFGTETVPEPATLLLLGSGLVAAAAIGRRVRR